MKKIGDKPLKLSPITEFQNQKADFKGLDLDLQELYHFIHFQILFYSHKIT